MLLWITVSIDIIQGSAIDFLTVMKRMERETEVGPPCVRLTKHLSEKLKNAVLCYEL